MANLMTPHVLACQIMDQQNCVLSTTWPIVFLDCHFLGNARGRRRIRLELRLGLRLLRVGVKVSVKAWG